MLLRILIISFVLLHTTEAFSEERAEPLVHIGDTKKNVRKLYGKPERSGKYFDSYVSSGLVFTYSGKNEIIAIEGTKMQSGAAYKGILSGVGLDEKLDVAERIWGPRVLSESDKSYFKPTGYLITVVFLELMKVNDFRSNTIESIEVRRYDNSIVGVWETKSKTEFIKINEDDTALLCKFSKKLGVISSEGTISPNGMLTWGKWFSTKSTNKYTAPNIGGPNNIYLAENEILLGWMTDLKTYHKPLSVPKECPFGL